MQNKRHELKPILEGALNVTIIVIIMLFNSYVPLFSVVGIYLLPIPITVLYIRHNIKVTLSAVFVSAVLITMFVGPIQAFVVSLMYGLTGVTLGYCIRREFKFSRTILLLTVVSSIGVIVPVIVSSYIVTNTGLTGLINQSITVLQESRNMAADFYKGIGINEAQMEQYYKMLEAITPELLLALLPGMLVVSALFSAYVNYAVTKSILKRLRYNVVEMTPYSLIYIDNRIGAFIISIVLIGIIVSTRNIAIGRYISGSAMLVMQVIFVISGTAVISYYFINKLKLRKGLVVAIILFLVFSQFNLFLMYIGFADLLFDFRKIDPNRLIKKKVDK